MELEEVAAAELPCWSTRSSPGRPRVWPEAVPSCVACIPQRRRPKAALFDYAAWIEQQLEGCGERVALGADELDELIGAARLRWPRPPTTSWPSATSSSRPCTRRGARPGANRPAPQRGRGGRSGQGRRTGRLRDGAGRLPRAMLRARAFIAEHDLATLPADDAHRGHAHAQAHAQHAAARGVLRAGRLRPAHPGRLHRHALGRWRPTCHARAQLGLAS